MENTENITEVKLDSKDRAYATGKRKNSIARVWLKRGAGSISVNGKDLDKYLSWGQKISQTPDNWGQPLSCIGLKFCL